MRIISLSPTLDIETLKIKRQFFLVVSKLHRVFHVIQTEQPSDSTFIYIVRDATHHKQMMWFQLQTLPPPPPHTSRDPRVLLQ